MGLKLRIPDRYAPALAEFVRLSPEELAAFLAATNEEGPTLALTELTESIASRLSIDPKRMGEIVRALADLQAVREGLGLSVGDFVSELRAAIEASQKDDLRPPDWTAFENAIAEALTGENALAVSSKALTLMGEYPCVYCTGRVLTDLRPIFKSDVEQEPAAFIVTHTLKIVYHEHEADHRELYVTLDRDDLERLKGHLERALKKESTLANPFEKGLRILQVKQ